ncbi:hypothetical protein [Myxococcus landrumensis]|uniref:Uncharacterized protein n=1 Tax=Myxococcus landrumensis TaxID=2813577 RepID=A0ABX7N6E8_9BACT|nr:hypothetical protein [Myxococcus landrumus]QSQ14023.1 hypothetical protein JY572_37875 [Myxococcus landrumus]
MKTFTLAEVEAAVQAIYAEAFPTSGTISGATYTDGAREVMVRLGIPTAGLERHRQRLPTPAPKGDRPLTPDEAQAELIRLFGEAGGTIRLDTSKMRARLATAVPEVPALKAETHYRCADPDCEAPERPAPKDPTDPDWVEGYVVDTEGAERLTMRCATPGCRSTATFTGPDRHKAASRLGWTMPVGGVVYCRGPHANRLATVAQAPEAAAPEVVWEGEGVRVSKHPDSPPGDYMVSYPGRIGEGGALVILARALAEAKQEAEPVIHALRQYQHRDEHRLTETVARLVGERLALSDSAWKNGAESMRERAADFVLDTSIPIPIDFWQGTKKGLVAEFAKRLAERIRALSLEGE